MDELDMDREPEQLILNYARPTTGRKLGRQKLLLIARLQKGVLVFLLVCVIDYVGLTALAFASGPWTAESMERVSSVVGILSMIGVVPLFVLCLEVHGPLAGILLGLLSLVPLVNLIVLLATSVRATHILRANGVRVGLFGADLKTI